MGKSELLRSVMAAAVATDEVLAGNLRLQSRRVARRNVLTRRVDGLGWPENAVEKARLRETGYRDARGQSGERVANGENGEGEHVANGVGSALT